MKRNFLPFIGKAVWQNNKPFIWFLLSLLLVYSVLKIIFYQYNYQLLFSGDQSGISWQEKFSLIKWSLGADLLVLLCINAFLLFALTVGRFFSQKLSAWVTIPLFVVINSFAVILNVADIFYYRFHYQRSNADLLYVLDHPVNRLMNQNILVIFGFIIAILGIVYLMWFLHRRLFAAFVKGDNNRIITAILFICLGIPFVFKNTFTKLLHPAYPLIELKSNQLPVIQNSFHTLIYSVFRKGETVELKNYFEDTVCDSIMPIRKTIEPDIENGGTKNIVLFIMESVPYDFFDSASAYKVAMPFFDSLLEKSSFYNNAFCFAHESNKGITAILAGIPTVSDIPVYHSANVNMPITKVGNALKKLNYQSLFCIGDEYDNFGFAKCMNWLGFDNYYSKESIANYKKLPTHSMGLQDEYVLSFFRQKIQEQKQPFLAVNYNISTHFPYDIPKDFSASLPAGYSAAMKAMRYYDNSLQQFFSQAKKEPWFANTQFIFCSDHWMFPDGKKGTYSSVASYRIPIILFDPARNEKKFIEHMVSQFDVLGTILATAGYKDSIISYGNNLLGKLQKNKVVFTKANTNLYQALDSSYVLGFNISTGSVEFLYNYKSDKELKNNLIKDPASQPKLRFLTLQMQAFMQKVKMQSSGIPFK